MEGIVLLLGSLGLLITITCAFLITQLTRKVWIKFILVPLMLTFGVLFFININQIMGYPFQGVPQGQFEIQGLRVTADQGAQDGSAHIEFWALQNGHSRLYSIPFDSDIMKKMQQAMAAGKSGMGRPCR